MRSCLGLMLEMGQNPSQLLKSTNWWANECHQQERHDCCAMCHVSCQYCSSAPFYISPFTPFSCPPPPHLPWSRMSALILFWPNSCTITGKYRIDELNVKISQWFHLRIPKTGSENLAFLIRHLSKQNNFRQYRWLWFPIHFSTGTPGSAKSSLVIWMTRNSSKNKREFVIYHGRHWQTGKWYL